MILCWRRHGKVGGCRIESNEMKTSLLYKRQFLPAIRGFRKIWVFWWLVKQSDMYLENFTQIKIFLKYRPNKPIEINNESSMLFLVITSNKGKHKVITLYNLWDIVPSRQVESTCCWDRKNMIQEWASSIAKRFSWTCEDRNEWTDVNECRSSK